MKKFCFKSHSPQETISFAKKLSGLLKRGDVLGLFGDLGSGKTTFIKGLAKGLGFKNIINSPSFVILKIYKAKQNNKIILYHFDLYRLGSLKELEDAGFDDFIDNSGVCVIEWADKAKALLPKNYLKIKIKILKSNNRLIDLIPYGFRYYQLVRKFNSKFDKRGV